MLIVVSWLHCCIKSWGGLCILCPPHLQSWGDRYTMSPPPATPLQSFNWIINWFNSSVESSSLFVSWVNWTISRFNSSIEPSSFSRYLFPDSIESLFIIPCNKEGVACDGSAPSVGLAPVVEYLAVKLFLQWTYFPMMFLLSLVFLLDLFFDDVSSLLGVPFIIFLYLNQVSWNQICSVITYFCIYMPGCETLFIGVPADKTIT